jgi:hypothetical protein
MQAQQQPTEAGRTAIWCAACGIPYAADTLYCANCGAQLADMPDTAAGEVDAAASPAEGLDPASPTETEDVPPEIDLDAVYPAPPTSLLGRIRQRQRPLSEDEVEAAAAVIIARAQEEIANGAEEASPRDALALLPDLLPDPVVEAALQRRRERDRLWIIAGIVCSILLILIALAFSRYLAGGLPAR